MYELIMYRLTTLKSEFDKCLFDCTEIISNLMVEKKQCWIVDQSIIFKPEFNSSLDDYSNIISNYRILIFSNYNNPYICLKNNNNHELVDYKLYDSSLYNIPLHNSLSSLVNLKKLTLGDCFNISLDDSLYNLHNLEELTFGFCFNIPLGDSLSKLVNLKKLTFGILIIHWMNVY